METFKLKGTLDEHNLMVTDVRFSGNSARLATSSFDKIVKVWEVESVSTISYFIGRIHQQLDHVTQERPKQFFVHSMACSSFAIANLVDLSFIHRRDILIFLLDLSCRQATH